MDIFGWSKLTPKTHQKMCVIHRDVSETDCLSLLRIRGFRDDYLYEVPPRLRAENQTLWRLCFNGTVHKLASDASRYCWNKRTSQAHSDKYNRSTARKDCSPHEATMPVFRRQNLPSFSAKYSNVDMSMKSRCAFEVHSSWESDGWCGDEYECRNVFLYYPYSKVMTTG